MKDNNNNNGPDIEKFLNYLDKETADKIRQVSTRKKRKHHHKHKKSKSKDKDKKNKTKKSVFSDEKFILNGNYNLIKLLGYGTFGEIMLAFDNTIRRLRAIKFELFSAKNAQLKHEYTIYEQLNTIEEKTSHKKLGKDPHDSTIKYHSETLGKIMNNYIDTTTHRIIGIPKVYLFDTIEGKYSYMVMDFLGPSINDLFQLMQKKLSLQTVCILSQRYKDKKTGAHIAYREKRQMVGTVRYASINTQIGIEQSRRDDIEAVGYVLVYLALGRLPWMRVGKEKGKGHIAKVLEKKLITPPEILCKKLPKQFAFLFQYLRKLKFEERPDYNMLKCLFAEMFMTKFNLSKNEVFTFDWFKDVNNEENEDDKYAMKLNKEKSSLNEINENDEINNLDKNDDSSKVLEENGEHEDKHGKDEDEKKEEDLNNENLNIEEEQDLINENNKEEDKKEKSSSGSYGLIKSDPIKQNK